MSTLNAEPAEYCSLCVFRDFCVDRFLSVSVTPWQISSYKAKDPRLSRTVAIKVPPPHMTAGRAPIVVVLNWKSG
jgi:hypothetical protein